jgi:glycosyltransferase involved in cell wall biosynthesis
VRGAGGGVVNDTVVNPRVRRLSAFFPCYNDALSIGKMVSDVTAALEPLVDEFEVIVVNDGSRDDSLAVLQRLQGHYPRLRIVNHERNRGYGGALISGFANSSYEWVFYTDGDAQYDASEVGRLVAAVADDTDVVQGFKIGRGDPWYRKVIGRTYHHLVRLLFRLPVRDTDCDFRLVNRRVLDQVSLRSATGVICVEMMFEFKRVGARFVEVGVSHRDRPHGRSQFFRLPAIGRAAVQLVSLWWRLVVRGSRGDRPTIDS